MSLSMGEIARRLRAADYPAVDAVVGIQTGGRIPATLLSFHLGLPLYMLPINFRDEDNNPRFDEPRVLGACDDLPPDGCRVLLVDDVSVSGKTMDMARQLLPGRDITTFVLKGQGDLVLFPEIKPCVNWPWLSA
ncbi:MAG: hypothetical protein GWM87_03280 [Xanthomonadales bacterium]|nr:phosphoribosyltransferase [Xanthomonadales bacterium]NIX12066.1 hypothetical protein [Xanthomonadales bacterium]